MTPEQTRAQLEAITTSLVELSLCDEQFYPSVRDSGNGDVMLTIPGTPNLSVAMRNINYSEIYEELERSKSFNFRMLDGAMVQLLYTFKNGAIESHRLAYFPSPILEAFQNEPELYENDEIYADIVKRNVVPFPIRFDYSDSVAKHIDIRHPKSHLTLGQYQNCRIPVHSPLTPIVFITFLLRNFYNTAYHVHEGRLNIPLTYFPECISQNERGVLHISVSPAAA